jgi:hypothetical protein
MRAVSPAGRLLERVLELDFDTQRFTVSWGDVTAEEAAALKILVQERDKYTAERHKTEREEQQAEARMQERQRRQGQL